MISSIRMYDNLFRELSKYVLKNARNKRTVFSYYANVGISEGVYLLYSFPVQIKFQLENLKVVPNGKGRFILGIGTENCSVYEKKATSPENFRSDVAREVAHDLSWGHIGFQRRLSDDGELPEYADKVFGSERVADCASDIEYSKLVTELCKAMFDFLKDSSTCVGLRGSYFPRVKGEDRKIIPILLINIQDIPEIQYYKEEFPNSYRHGIEYGGSVNDFLMDGIISSYGDSFSRNRRRIKPYIAYGLSTIISNSKYML